MGMDSKMDFMRTVEKGLASNVTVSNMENIMKIISDVLDGYDMRCVAQWEDDKDDYLESYLSALSVQNRSEKTIARYEYRIKKMMQFVKVPTRRIAVYHLRAYLAAEKKRGISDSTLEGDREIFSAYFNWLQRENLIERNPAANLGAIKVAKKEKLIYSDVEFEKLNQACYTVRDRAIINFLSSTGCRISEAMGLNRNDIDLERLECVVHGKGNKERYVYMNGVTGLLLRNYLMFRRDDNPALFVDYRGKKRLEPGGVRVMLNRIAKDCGLKNVHPHKFRRTFATELCNHGMAIQEVAKILGHERLDTVMKYVVQDNQHVKMDYKRYA